MREKIIKKKNQQKIYYNRGTKDLPPLKKGDIIHVHPLPTDNQGRWIQAKTEQKADIRLYIIRTEGETSVQKKDKTQDNPEEAEEWEESRTAPQGMESTTQTR